MPLHLTAVTPIVATVITFILLPAVTPLVATVTMLILLPAVTPLVLKSNIKI